MGRCIGIDLGTKRVGLALSDSLRNELGILGWKVDDSKEGQEVSKNK